MGSLQKQLSDNHRGASKMLAFALHADSADTWLGAKVVWLARLSDIERAALAFSALKALEPDHREWVFDAVFDDPDMPMVPLFSAMHEAACWADWADYGSTKACTLAGYNRLAPNDQAAFLIHVTERAAA